MLWQVNVTLYIDRIHFPSSLIIEVSISSHYSSLRAHRVRSLSPEQWPLPPPHTQMWAQHRDGLLTISLYASLLSLGVSLMVPMNTKNNPRAKDRATMVIVLGDAIFRHRACSSRFPLKWMRGGRFFFPLPVKMHQGGGASGAAAKMATRWSPLGP